MEVSNSLTVVILISRHLFFFSSLEVVDIVRPDLKRKKHPTRDKNKKKIYFLGHQHNTFHEQGKAIIHMLTDT